MMSILRAARDGFFAAAVAVGLGWVSGAMAQNYPAKPIRLVVPFAPGGPADVIGRIIGQQLDIILGQSIVVENRGGAGGTLGARLAAMAEPDGYTVMFANTSTMSINPAVYRRLDYDPAKAFAPVALIGITSNILVVNPALPVKTVAELVAYGKAKPRPAQLFDGRRRNAAPHARRNVQAAHRPRHHPRSLQGGRQPKTWSSARCR